MKKNSSLSNKKDNRKKVSSLRVSGKLALNIFLALFFLVMSLIAYDFGKIAIKGEVFGVDLNERALNTYLKTDVIRSKRGSIYDKNGLALAEELTSYTIYANLNPNYGSTYVEDIDYTSQQLSEHLSLSAESIKERLSKENVSQVEFGAAGRGLSYIQKSAIEELNLPGIGFNEHSTRFYANGIFASHSLGYAVYDNEAHRLVGHMGLELAFDEELAGKNGELQYFRDRKGYKLPNSTPVTLTEAVKGVDIYTTIDFTLQNLLEDALSRADEEFQPESIIAVVADAKTNEILAAANRQTFDPNLRNVENYYNPIIQYPFEPGSTIKIFTYAAAINEGKYDSNQYYPSGSINVANMNIKDWKTGGWGSISLDQGFYISSNTAIINLITKHIDTKTWLKYLEDFGFGAPTNLGLPGESGGTLPSSTDYTQQLTSGFGQGFLATPMQHIRALSAILNGGEMLQPQIISKIYDPNTGEIVKESERTVVGTPITASTAEQVKELMYGVVHDEKMGSGYASYRMDNIGIGGKTGTAQIADPNGGYLRGSNDYVYSFVGFAPYDDPQYTFYISVQQPQPGRTGGHGIISEIMKYFLNNTLGQGDVIEFTPTESPEYTPIEVADYSNQSVSEIVSALSEQGLTPIVIGDGEFVVNQSPNIGSAVLVGDKIFLTTGNHFAMPDLYGWTKSEIIQFGSLVDIKFKIEGDGLAYEQTVKAGDWIERGSNCEVKLIEDLSQLYVENTPVVDDTEAEIDPEINSEESDSIE